MAQAGVKSPEKRERVKMLAVLHFDVAQLAGATFHLAVQRGVGANVGSPAPGHRCGLPRSTWVCRTGWHWQHFNNACAHRVALRG